MNKLVCVLPFLLPLLTEAEALTPFSGTLLKRPILMVHGINADMGSWGGQPAERICRSPQATFAGYVYAYVPVAGRTWNSVNYSADQFPLWNGSGPTIPAPQVNAPGQVWRDLPLNHAYYRVDMGTTGSGLTKTTSTQATNALPPVWAYQDPISMPELMQMVVGTKYTVRCSDGTVFQDQIDFPWNILDSEIGTRPKWAMEGMWANKPIGLHSEAWYRGYVKSYKAGSGAAVLAAKYGLSTAISATDDHSDGINHNGLEFYTSTDPQHENPDPFCRPDATEGAEWNSVRNRNELGQTNQLIERMRMVLDEYFPDWRTNPTRRIDIVCHSQGCLVTRNAVRTNRSPALDNPINHLNHIVSLNSPALGTAIATDRSGVPVIADMREFVYSLYRSKILDPIRIKVPAGPVDFSIKVWDPFKEIRQTAENFTNTDQYLAYPINFPAQDWEPPTSQIGIRSGTCGSPSVSYLGKDVISDIAAPVPGMKLVRYNYRVTCSDGHVENTSRKMIDFAQANVSNKPETVSPESLIPEIKAFYNGAEYGDYGVRSKFISALAESGFPTRPYNGSRISFTAYAGTVPYMASTFLDRSIGGALAPCKDALNWLEEARENKARAAGGLFQDLGKFLAMVNPLVVVDAASAVAAVPFQSCENYIGTIDALLRSMFNSLDQHWSPYSDFVVDKSSQKMQGLFPSWAPFRTREFTLREGELGVPHMDFGLVGPNNGILRGACAHGEDYFEALQDPPLKDLFLPAIFSILMQ